MDGERPWGVRLREEGRRGPSRRGIQAYSESGMIKMAEVSALKRKKWKKTHSICKTRWSSEMIHVKKKRVRSKEDVTYKGNREKNGWKIRIFLLEGKNIQVIFFFFLQTFSSRMLLTKQNTVFLVLYGIFLTLAKWCLLACNRCKRLFPKSARIVTLHLQSEDVLTGNTGRMNYSWQCCMPIFNGAWA